MARPSGPELLAEARALLPALSAFRRDLHRHPELGGRERRTAARIAAALQRLGMEVRTGLAGTGVVGLLRAREGSRSPAIALRADIDALPVAEQSEAAYRSVVCGVSHACGHDGHAAILLGAAELLRRHAGHLPGDALFVFQPSEDTLPGGARAMVREGALGGARGVLSLHLNPLFPAGTVALREGWATCSSVSFRLRLQGRGGHVADPAHALNPLLPAAALIAGAEELRRELASEAQPLILAFGALHGGSAANVIPDAAEAAGSLRAPTPELLQAALTRFRELARAVSEGAGAGLQLEVEEGYPPVFNDPAMTARFREAAAEVIGSGHVAELDRPLATGDDVAFFHQQVPGVYWQLGTRDPARGFGHPLHSPRFDFDEELLALGAAVQARAAWEMLVKEGSR